MIEQPLSDQRMIDTRQPANDDEEKANTPDRLIKP
jgi:hypothetical protein